MSIREPVSTGGAGPSIECFHCGWDAKKIKFNIYYCKECFTYMYSYAHNKVHFWPTGRGTRILHEVFDDGECYEREIQGGQ